MKNAVVVNIAQTKRGEPWVAEHQTQAQSKL